MYTRSVSYHSIYFKLRESCNLFYSIQIALNSTINKVLSRQKSLTRRGSHDRLTPPDIRFANHQFIKHGVFKGATYSGYWLSGKLHGLYVYISQLLFWILLDDLENYTARIFNIFRRSRKLILFSILTFSLN